MTDYVTLTINEGIAHITLDDGKANAFGFDMMGAFNEALDKAEAEADIILLKGRENMTCAGFNLKVMQNGVAEDVARMVHMGGALLHRLFIMPKPVILASTGHAMAAGALLVLAADYVIAAQGDYKYGLNETAIGMVLPHYGFCLARYRLAPHAYDTAVVGAQLYDPQAACSIGYVHEVIAPDKLDEAALTRAQNYQKLSLKAYKGNKLKTRGTMAEEIKASLEKERNIAVTT